MSPKSPVHFPCTSLARTGSEVHRAGKGGAGSSGFGAAAGDSLASVSAGGQEIGWQTCALTRPATKNRPHPCMRIQFRKRPPDCWGFRGVWPFAIPPVLRKHSCYCSLPIPPMALQAETLPVGCAFKHLDTYYQDAPARVLRECVFREQGRERSAPLVLDSHVPVHFHPEPIFTRGARGHAELLYVGRVRSVLHPGPPKTCFAGGGGDRAAVSVCSGAAKVHGKRPSFLLPPGPRRKHCFL